MKHMNAERLLNTYIETTNNIQQLSQILKKKIINLEIVDDISELEKNFTTLIHYISTENIQNVYDTNIVNDIPLFPSFTKYTTLTSFNIQLAQVLIYYRDYLIYQLERMGVNPVLINETHNLYDLILLLDKIKIRYKIYITWEDDLLHTNINNTLNIQIYEQRNNNRILQGQIEIWENDHKYATYDLAQDDLQLRINTQGIHQYTIKYLENNQYCSATLTKDIQVDYGNPYGHTSFLLEAELDQNDDILCSFIPPSLIDNNNLITTMELNNDDDIRKNYIIIENSHVYDMNKTIGDLYLDKNDDLRYE